MMQTIVIAMQQQANDSIHNIQLDQKDENIIPVAPQLEDIPDEQPITASPKAVIAEPLKTSPSSTERPDPTLTKAIVPEKTVVPAKKLSKPVEKPFWLQAAMAKPKTSNVLKRSKAKIKSQSNGKPNPNPTKKPVVLKSSTTKTINKPIIKQTTKQTIKPITKPTTKPKAVLPPKNDY